MSLETNYIVGAVLVGIGATLIMDLWALFLRRVFNIPSLNYCLVGRWLSHMPEGTFQHVSIAAAEKRSAECALGWTAHYLIGVMFAFFLVIPAGGAWLQQPSLVTALGFGLVTVLIPFFIMQPALGMGIAAANTPAPARARLKSLMTHAIFGIGLYLSAMVVRLALQT